MGQRSGICMTLTGNINFLGAIGQQGLPCYLSQADSGDFRKKGGEGPNMKCLNDFCLGNPLRIVGRTTM